ncbi:MAG: hypothetical protein U9N19_09835, partial [Thermodesulfobacteriota bacterium]|nr:hypothetical protein [Thermodesulfobacteriota bacterium]
VARMCSKELSTADINAICKARGFSTKEAKNRKFLENFILSDQGVAKAMDALTQKENIVLHALKQKSRAVDVAFFDRIYGPPNRKFLWSTTFTQKYKNVLKQVKQSLVRRGVLLFAEDTGAWGKNKKMERLIFFFPAEFQKFLPLPIEPIRDISGPGHLSELVLRKKLLEITRGGSNLPVIDKQEFRLHITGGELLMGKKAFKAEYLHKWQKAGWADALAKRKSNKFRAEQFCLTDAVSYTLSLLRSDEWITAGQMEPVLEIFCHGLHLDDVQHDPHEICHAGWRWGCLSRNTANNQTCYRMVVDYPETGRDLPFTRYLQPGKGQDLIVDLANVPFKDLEALAGISDFEIIGSQLTAAPDMVRLGRVFNSICQEPLMIWLRDNVPCFGDAIKKVKARWGKLIIHQDLLVAKVKDLSLKVAIEKSFSDPAKLVFLPNDFIVFPRGLLGEIEKLVTKSGFVVRSIP